MDMERNVWELMVRCEEGYDKRIWESACGIWIGGLRRGMEGGIERNVWKLERGDMKSVIEGEYEKKRVGTGRVWRGGGKKMEGVKRKRRRKKQYILKKGTVRSRRQWITYLHKGDARVWRLGWEK